MFSLEIHILKILMYVGSRWFWDEARSNIGGGRSGANAGGLHFFSGGRQSSLGWAPLNLASTSSEPETL